MKRMVITYGDLTLYDDQPGRLSWSETEGGALKVEVGPARAAGGGGGGGGLGAMMAAASRRQTEAKRAQLAAQLGADAEQTVDAEIPD